jgi:hypothetical protein
MYRGSLQRETKAIVEQCIGVGGDLQWHYNHTKLLKISFTFLKELKISKVGLLQGVPGGKVSILVGHSICHSKQKSVYVHMSYSERFPR